VVKAYVAKSPKPPETLHYKGDGGRERCQEKSTRSLILCATV
jgi:hypothetical protein